MWSLNMVQYLVLATINDTELFADYIKGHIPTIAQFGGRVVFRSTDNAPVFGTETWDAIAIQEWPSESAFEAWWHSVEYRPWALIRDKAATVTIVKCQNLAGVNAPYTLAL
jgi:uncharacterized protein (DUF1330 family)